MSTTGRPHHVPFLLARGSPFFSSGCRNGADKEQSHSWLTTCNKIEKHVCVVGSPWDVGVVIEHNLAWADRLQSQSSSPSVPSSRLASSNPHNSALCAGRNVTAYIWQKRSCVLGRPSHNVLSNRDGNHTSPLIPSPMTVPMRNPRATVLNSLWDTILLQSLRSPGIWRYTLWRVHVLGIFVSYPTFAFLFFLVLEVPFLVRCPSLSIKWNWLLSSIVCHISEHVTRGYQSKSPTHLFTVIGWGVCMWASWANQTLLWDFCWITEEEALCLDQHCLL